MHYVSYTLQILVFIRVQERVISLIQVQRNSYWVNRPAIFITWPEKNKKSSCVWRSKWCLDDDVTSKPCCLYVAISSMQTPLGKKNLLILSQQLGWGWGDEWCREMDVSQIVFSLQIRSLHCHSRACFEQKQRKKKLFLGNILRANFQCISLEVVICRYFS